MFFCLEHITLPFVWVCVSTFVLYTLAITSGPENNGFMKCESFDAQELETLCSPAEQAMVAIGGLWVGPACLFANNG